MKMKSGSLFTIFLAVLVAVSCSEREGTSQPVAYDSLYYEIHMGDRLAGKQISWQNDEGHYRYIFEFNDRGRGPFFDETITLDEKGLIAKQSVIGHNYLKDTVNEVFTVKQGNAYWKNSSEEGSKPFSGNAFYSSLESSFGGVEHLVRKLLSSPDRSIAILPSGNARVVGQQQETFGDSITLDLISLSGFDFTPMNIWIDQNQRFFALLYPGWFTCMRAGHADLRKSMEAIQKEAEDSYFRQLAQKLTHTPSGTLAIQNVAIFDAEGKSLLPDMTVLIEGNRISAVERSDELVLPEGTEIIEGEGKTLLPGLFDMHVHISKQDGILHLAAGVTSARDLANNLQLPELKQNFDNNVFIGPRIPVMAGIIDGAGKYAGPTEMLINNVEEGYEDIQEYKDLGYKQIKLYSSIKPEWVPPLTKRAHDLGMRVSGHIPAFMTAEQAVKAGYDEIQHVNMIFLNFLPDTIDTRSPLRFTMVAQHGDQLEVESEAFRSFVDLLKQNDIVVDPTVSIFEGMFKARPGEPDPAFAMILDRLPVQIRRRYFTGGLPVPEGMEERYATAHDRMLEVIKELFDGDITIVPGTDAMAGFAMHRELENYHRAGIPTLEVLALATTVSAKVCGVDNELGSITEGKLADMILVNGNPVENISDIRKVDLTIKDGRVYDPRKLYEAIGVEHYQ